MARSASCLAFLRLLFKAPHNTPFVDGISLESASTRVAMSQSPRRRLEDRLRNVMLIPAVQILDVQVEFAFLHECLQELLDQFRLQIPDPRHLELRLVDKVRPTREIHDDASQGFIQRHVGMSEPGDAAPIAECFVQRLAENPAHIFHRVVPVDFEIAFCR